MQLNNLQRCVTIFAYMPISKSELRLPIVELPKVLGLPRYSFQEGLEKIPKVARKYGSEQLFNSHAHEVFSLSPVSKHHPRLHEVFWVLQKDTTADPFGSWQALTKDEEMLATLTDVMTKLVKEQDCLVYTLQGCEPLDQSSAAVTWPNGPLWPGGLASLPYVHFHQVGMIERQDVTGYYEYPEKNVETESVIALGKNTLSKKELLLSGLFNWAGEEAIARYSMYLDMIGYGRKQQFQQTIGMEQQLRVTRTVYGFDSLADAVQKSHQVRSMVAESWIETALSIFEGSLRQEAVGLRAMQGVIPSFALVVLPPKLQQQYGLNHHIITFPFTVTHPLPALTEGGVLIQRN